MHHIRTGRPMLALVCLALSLIALSAYAPCSAAPAGSKGAQPNGERVDINAATVEQLVTIPGIGKVMAERIVQFREQHGPFSKVDELLKVKGIGEKSLEKLRPYVKVGKSA